MENLIPTIYLVLSCISPVSCSNSPNRTIQAQSTNTLVQSQPETSPESVTESPGRTETNIETESASSNINNMTEKNVKPTRKLPKQPQTGTVKELLNSDLLCYVTLVDKKDVEN